MCSVDLLSPPGVHTISYDMEYHVRTRHAPSCAAPPPTPRVTAKEGARFASASQARTPPGSSQPYLRGCTLGERVGADLGSISRPARERESVTRRTIYPRISQYLIPFASRHLRILYSQDEKPSMAGVREDELRPVLGHARLRVWVRLLSGMPGLSKRISQRRY